MCHIPGLEFRCNKQVQRFRVNDSMAAVGWALYPCRLPFIFDLLSQVLSVTIHAVSMPTLQRVRLQSWYVVITNFACEALDDLGGWCLGRLWPKSCSFENRIWPLHVYLYQALLVPSKVPK